MEITELGAIGELIGGAAVLVTLVYLAVQVRQGNKVGSRESYRAWVSEVNRVLFEPQRDPEFMEIFQRANHDWNSLSLRDQGRVNAVYAPLFLLFQEVFAQTEKGDVEEHLTHQIDTIAATILQMPGTGTWWKLNEGLYPPSFYSHMNELLASENRPPPLHHALPWYAAEGD